MAKNILVRGFCPLKIKITQLSDVFCLNTSPTHSCPGINGNVAIVFAAKVKEKKLSGFITVQNK